jgi:hypothetical protein
MVPNHQPIDDILDFRISRNVPTETTRIFRNIPPILGYSDFST